MGGRDGEDVDNAGRPRGGGTVSMPLVGSHRAQGKTTINIRPAEGSGTTRGRDREQRSRQCRPGRRPGSQHDPVATEATTGVTMSRSVGPSRQDQLEHLHVWRNENPRSSPDALDGGRAARRGVEPKRWRSWPCTRRSEAASPAARRRRPGPAEQEDVRTNGETRAHRSNGRST